MLQEATMHMNTPDHHLQMYFTPQPCVTLPSHRIRIIDQPRMRSGRDLVHLVPISSATLHRGDGPSAPHWSRTLIGGLSMLRDTATHDRTQSA
jgi:hypothetical protein